MAEKDVVSAARVAKNRAPTQHLHGSTCYGCSPSRNNLFFSGTAAARRCCAGLRLGPAAVTSSKFGGLPPRSVAIELIVAYAGNNWARGQFDAETVPCRCFGGRQRLARTHEGQGPRQRKKRTEVRFSVTRDLPRFSRCSPAQKSCRCRAGSAAPPISLTSLRRLGPARRLLPACR